MSGKHMHNKRFWAAKGVFFLVVGLAFAAAIGWVVMALWNAILPRITGVNPLGYWDAVGLLILCRILFGSFHHKGPGPGGKKRKRWREKWQNMSEEERAEMKARWKERCRPNRRDSID